MEKTCSKCKRNLDTSNFWKHKTHSDGYTSQCKECNKKYRQTEHYKEIKRKKDKKYYKNHKKEFSEYGKKYYIKNRINILKRVKKYRIENKDKIRKYWQSEDGKRAKKGKDTRYHRHLDFIPMFDNPFMEEFKVHYHHINNFLVVPLPAKSHEKTYHSNRLEHRERANVMLYYIYGTDFERLTSENL